MATGSGSRGRGGEAAGELHQQPAFGRGLLGLAAASAATTLAVSEPPPWLDRNAYSVAISGLFFAGISQVVAASVWAPAGGRGREAAGELHQQPAFGRGLLGLAAASAATTLAVSEPPPWLDRNAYSVAISGLFFAGISQVVAASVWAPAGGRGGVAGRKLVMYSLVVTAGLVAAASLLL